MCQHFLLPSRKKFARTHGTTDTCDNRERRCDMMMIVHLCQDSAWSSAVHEAQGEATLQVGHRKCGAGGTSISSNAEGVSGMGASSSSSHTSSMAHSSGAGSDSMCLERTERARVALACVWMQLLKLRGSSHPCTKPLIVTTLKHRTSVTCMMWSLSSVT